MGGRSRSVYAGGINTHYLVAGEGAPVILLHGGADDVRGWKFNFETLSQQHLVYAPDLVGYGKSDKPDVDYSPDFFVDFLHSFIEALNLKRVNIIGHSLGGGIALGFALRFPDMVVKLVLIDNAGFSDEVSTTAKVLAPIHALSGTLREGRVVAILARRYGLKQPFHFLGRLSEIQAPTLIIWGAKDRILPVTQAYAASELIKNAKLYIFPKCGHAPHREKSEEFNRLVLEFLSQNEN
jgi:4,5:9,10-diseco-3-hydroxy-5,9,17-trioxoandrosta-1(10),2-diene-4-oate hydrolase